MNIDCIADNTVPTHSMIQQHLKHFLCVSYRVGISPTGLVHSSLCKLLPPPHPSPPSIYHLKQYISFYAIVQVLLITDALLHLFCCLVIATLYNSNVNTSALLLSEGMSASQLKASDLSHFWAHTSEQASVTFYCVKVLWQEGARIVSRTGERLSLIMPAPSWVLPFRASSSS